MTERLRTLWLAAAALAGFLAMFMSGSQPTELDAIKRPTSLERGGNGLYAAAQWLRRSGHRVVSWREHYGALTRAGNGAGGEMLVVALPGAVGVETAELAALDRWLRAGNTLLVLAAFADAPDWAGNDEVIFDVAAVSGLEFEPRAGRRAASAGDVPAPSRPVWLRSRDQTAVGAGDHALLRGVRQLQTHSDREPQAWRLKLPYGTFALELAREPPAGHGVLWMRRLGAGRIILSGYGSLLTNRHLGDADNARLLSNIVAQYVAPGARVYFDDGRQGLAADYDPQRFYADPRLHWSVAIVFVVWLVWVLGSTRLRASVAPSPPGQAELLRSVAGFLARAVPESAAGRRLLQLFAHRLQRRGAPGRDLQATLRWLEGRAGIDPRDLALLRANEAALSRRARVSLRELHNLLVRIQGQLR